MVYYGPPTPLDPKVAWSKPNGDEVMVMQQHCGGENLIVYKGFVIPNRKYTFCFLDLVFPIDVKYEYLETFKFQSRRHPDYPFAVSIYINGLIDSRLSVCCEYKHKLNTRLGSKHGLFALRSVKKSEPCRLYVYLEILFTNFIKCVFFSFKLSIGKTIETKNSNITDYK